MVYQGIAILLRDVQQNLGYPKQIFNVTRQTWQGHGKDDSGVNPINMTQNEPSNHQ